MLELEKAHTDRDRHIYFWTWTTADGEVITLSSHQTNHTPHWCSWCLWGASIPCPVCADGSWYPWPAGDATCSDGDGRADAGGLP